MAEEEKTVSIRLFCSDPPQMHIKYKDKHELFRKFKENLEKFDFPTDEIYSYDWDNIHTRIRTADDVYIAVKDGVAKMFVRDPRNRERFQSFSADEDENENEEEDRSQGEREKGEDVQENRKRNSSPSPVRDRGRSRSEPLRGTRPYSDLYPYYPMPWNYYQWMYPSYAP